MNHNKFKKLQNCLVLYLSIGIIFGKAFGNSNGGEEKEEIQTRIEWKNYPLALHILLPFAGLCFLFGRKELYTKILLQIDRCCVSVCCPSFSKREKLLKWAGENLPRNWSSPSRTLSGGVVDLWIDGSLLCTLINMYIPGACSNPPRHWKKPPIHAQALAYKYFGITPIFTENELCRKFSPSLERKFLNYLQELQQAVKKRNGDEFARNFRTDYIARGMGLYTGEQFKKTTFYIYSNVENCEFPGGIMVHIKGPYTSQGTASIPAFHNLKTPNFRKKNAESATQRKSFLGNIAFDFSAFVTKKETDKESENIQISIEMEKDRAKVMFIPEHSGIYEINLITNGEILRDSPYITSIIENTSGARENFDGKTEEILKIPMLKKRKIISSYIDCIDVKLPCENSGKIIPTNIVQPENERKIIENPRKNEQTLNLNVENNQAKTSPISRNIAPEVSNFSALSLSEKRKFFTRQSRNSTFSDKENAGVHPLKVLSVIETIKRTNLNKKTSKSTPNLNASFHQVKNYWIHISHENLTSKIPEKSNSSDNSKNQPLKTPTLKSENSSSDLNVKFLSVEERKKKLLKSQKTFPNQCTNILNSENREKLCENCEKPNKSSQFKKAVNFFKNLEKIKVTKPVSVQKPRRLSLDFTEKRRNEKRKIGGSLRCTKTLDKFSITQIYFDIMKNGRNTFKGAINRVALTKTLNSIPTPSKLPEKNVGNHNFLQHFEMKKIIKKRRNSSSIFDNTQY